MINISKLLGVIDIIFLLIFFCIIFDIYRVIFYCIDEELCRT
jgi:hypothetical protein